MDDWVGYLEGEQSNVNGILLDVLSSGYEDWDYIAAVEGPFDKIFYFDFIADALKGKNIHFLPCGGKQSVLAFKALSAEYDWVNPPKFLFLCDKDFDDYLGKTTMGVWYTDFYSIESYIANREFVRYIVKKFSSKPLKTAELANFMVDFDKFANYMIEHLRAFGAYMCELRATGQHPDFNNFGIDQLFDLTKSTPTVACDRMKRATTKLEIEEQPEYRNLTSRARQFKHGIHKSWLRGKLALQVVRKAYDYAQKAAPQVVREKLPGSSHFGSGALNNAFGFMGAIPSLKLYCQSVM